MCYTSIQRLSISSNTEASSESCQDFNNKINLMFIFPRSLKRSYPSHLEQRLRILSQYYINFHLQKQLYDKGMDIAN